MDHYNDVLSETNFYRSMFENTNLYDCSNLNFGITYIQGSIRNFECMFQNCIYMIRCPKILPATTLTQSCYASMFYGCAGLTTLPKLPATTLTDSCYSNMFNGCISLKETPSDWILPATTLASYCYQYMFSGCTSLTTIPNLPATTLAVSCYASMFSGCKGLVEPPTGWYLPATTLAKQCYN